MSDSITASSVRPSYRVELLSEARPTWKGIAYRSRGGGDSLLAWSDVQRAMSAEVGEPQGVRTIVFDLVVEVSKDECCVRRFDAEPGRDALEVARAIIGALPNDRAEGSIKSMATDGIASRWYPDLESFEEANLGILA